MPNVPVAFREPMRKTVAALGLCGGVPVTVASTVLLLSSTTVSVSCPVSVLGTASQLLPSVYCTPLTTCFPAACMPAEVVSGERFTSLTVATPGGAAKYLRVSEIVARGALPSASGSGLDYR